MSSEWLRPTEPLPISDGKQEKMKEFSKEEVQQNFRGEGSRFIILSAPVYIVRDMIWVAKFFAKGGIKLYRNLRYQKPK